MNMIAGPNGQGQQWTNILIGTEKVQIPVYLTTSEYQVGVFTSGCPADVCKGMNRIDFSTQCPSVKLFPSDNFVQPNSALSNWHSQSMVSTVFSGNEARAEVNMQLWPYHRETTMNNLEIIGVDFSTSVFESSLSGFIGLKPYSWNSEQRTKNFMYQLRQQNLITNNIISFHYSGL
jgi:hypothetical protein